MKQCPYVLRLSVLSAVLVMGNVTMHSALASDCILYTKVDGTTKKICGNKAETILQQVTPSEEALAQGKEQTSGDDNKKTGMLVGAKSGYLGGTFRSLIEALSGRKN